MKSLFNLRIKWWTFYLFFQREIFLTIYCCIWPSLTSEEQQRVTSSGVSAWSSVSNASARLRGKSLFRWDYSSDDPHVEIRLLRVITAVKNLENVHSQSTDGFKFAWKKQKAGKNLEVLHVLGIMFRLCRTWPPSGWVWGGELLQPDVWFNSKSAFLIPIFHLCCLKCIKGVKFSVWDYFSCFIIIILRLKSGIL